MLAIRAVAAPPEDPPVTIGDGVADRAETLDARLPSLGGLASVGDQAAGQGAAVCAVLRVLLCGLLGLLGALALD